MRLGHDGSPPRGHPAALGPTRSSLARHERTCDSDDSDRAGPTGPPATTTLDAADVKASSTGAGVVSGAGEGLSSLNTVSTGI